MPNWLQKITSSLQTTSKTRNLPAVSASQLPAGAKRRRGRPGAEPLPNASLIYGLASSIMLVFGVYFIFRGLWFTGLLICLLAGCFLGLALHYMRR